MASSRLFRLLLAVVPFLAVSGCITVNRSDQSRGQTEPNGDAGEILACVIQPEPKWSDPAVWPQRLPVASGLRRNFASGLNATQRPMGVIVRTTGPVSAMRHGDKAAEKMERELGEDIALLMSRRRGPAAYRPFTVVAEGRGSFLFCTADDADAQEVWSGPAGRPSFYLKHISGRVGDGAAGTSSYWSGQPSDEPVAPPTPTVDTSRVHIERTWFAYYDARTEYGPAPKGVVVLLPGMFGTPKSVVDDTVGALRARGWCVMRMLAHPSRFTERASFVLVADKPVDQAAGAIAAELTDRAAECAYAVQGAMMYLAQERPEIGRLPRVLLGMSAGAMVLPTVLAREPECYSQAVVIAGGADFLRIALESNYTEWIDALRFNWLRSTQVNGAGGDVEKFSMTKAEPTAEQKNELLRAYHRHATLDSVQTGRLLSRVRTLFLLGTTDRAVPAHLGDALWQLAGRPERWEFDGGHEWTFFALPWHIGRVIDWLDAGLPGAASASPPVTPSGGS